MEPCLCFLTEDEIRCAFNVRLCVDLGALLGKDGVLKTFELATVVALLATIGAQCQGLRARATGVDEVDVVDLQVGGVSAKSSGFIIVWRIILALALRYGYRVCREAGGIRSLSVDGQRGLECLDVYLLFVRALGDEDTLSCSIARAQRVDSR